MAITQEAIESIGGIRVIRKEPRYIYNHCAKFLARASSEPRHRFVDLPENASRNSICEAWRFPIIDSFVDRSEGARNPGAHNQVTFIYLERPGEALESVELFGTFAALYQPLPLARVEDSHYFALTVLVPKGQVHTYKYRVDGTWRLDPINPQEVTLPSGERRSRFFTQNCNIPITFESWERTILDRLVRHILPFQTKEGKNFLDRYINQLDESARKSEVRAAYRFDESVGVLNYIDKVLAREEAHYLPSYRTCLDIIRLILRDRFKNTSLDLIPKEEFVRLYDEMKTDFVEGWPVERYGSPLYFLTLLRRHTYTGAFSHPKYHGNAGGAGWAYLRETFITPSTGQTIFDWARSQEAPLGQDPNYLG